MTPGNHPTNLAQRLEIEERAGRGATDSEIATAMQLRRSTVRKWRRRAKRHGRGGLAPRLGRPPSGPLGHAHSELRPILRELRLAHPGWGPVTLRLEASRDPRLQGLALPSRSRIAAFLKAEGLTRRYERHHPLQQPPAQPLTAPHEEWQLDAQGVRLVTEVGRVSVINTGDPYSHVRVGSLACLQKSKADAADYQLALRRSFLRYGLPQRLSLDHDSAFFDNTSASPYPSQLHLWLIGLGVEVRFIDRGRPTQHGFIERTHQLLDGQVLADASFLTPAVLQPTLDQRREFLNQTYPSRALGGQAPLCAFPEAAHSGRVYRPAGEAQLLEMERVYQYLTQHRWFRLTSSKGQFFLGRYRYGLGQTWANQMVELHFDAPTCEVVCQSADGQKTQRFPVKGLTPADLMGELRREQFPTYQYAFPWSAEVCRQNLLYQEVGGTTL